MFNCEKCVSTFTRKDTFLRHMKTHDGYQVACSVCSKKYSRKDILNRHMKNNHGMSYYLYNMV